MVPLSLKMKKKRVTNLMKSLTLLNNFWFLLCAVIEPKESDSDQSIIRQRFLYTCKYLSEIITTVFKNTSAHE